MADDEQEKYDRIMKIRNNPDFKYEISLLGSPEETSGKESQTKDNVHSEANDSISRQSQDTEKMISKKSKKSMLGFVLSGTYFDLIKKFGYYEGVEEDAAIINDSLIKSVRNENAADLKTIDEIGSNERDALTDEIEDIENTAEEELIKILRKELLLKKGTRRVKKSLRIIATCLISDYNKNITWDILQHLVLKRDGGKYKQRNCEDAITKANNSKKFRIPTHETSLKRNLGQKVPAHVRTSQKTQAHPVTPTKKALKPLINFPPKNI